MPTIVYILFTYKLSAPLPLLFPLQLCLSNRYLICSHIDIYHCMIAYFVYQCIIFVSPNSKLFQSKSLSQKLIQWCGGAVMPYLNINRVNIGTVCVLAFQCINEFTFFTIWLKLCSSEAIVQLWVKLLWSWEYKPWKIRGELSYKTLTSASMPH